MSEGSPFDEQAVHRFAIAVSEIARSREISGWGTAVDPGWHAHVGEVRAYSSESAQACLEQLVKNLDRANVAGRLHDEIVSIEPELAHDWYQATASQELCPVCAVIERVVAEEVAAERAQADAAKRLVDVLAGEVARLTIERDLALAEVRSGGEG